MSEWSSKQYLKFKNQRTQPAMDLAMRISALNPKSIIDIGCGPGNSTRVLKNTFPSSDILGIDSSKDMIKKAQNENRDIRFQLCDALSFEGNYDVIFSNACLQWIPTHEETIPLLMSKLNEGGTLAVQMPMNYKEPLYRIIDEMISNTKWGFDAMYIEQNKTLTPIEYHNILTKCSSSFDIFEIKYYHTFTEHQELYDWVKSTKLRPYLECMNNKMRTEFETEILERAKEKYIPTDNGEIIFGFNRFFFVAIK